jgi:hypothetical protein
MSSNGGSDCKILFEVATVTRLSTIGLVWKLEAIYTLRNYRDASALALSGFWYGLNICHESGRSSNAISRAGYSPNFGLDFSIAHAIPCSTLITLYSIL